MRVVQFFSPCTINTYMSSIRKQDQQSLGDIYGTLLNNVKRNIIKEKVKEEIGEVPLKDGGPLEKGGFTPTKLDPKKLNKKELVDNAYNIKRLSQVDDEEDSEEITPETEKVVRKSLNNFMRKKSIFDKLYENVMGADQGDMAGQDLAELGLDDATPDDELGAGGGEDEVTFTIDRETAQKLCDVLQGVLDMGGEEGADGEEDEFGGDEFGSDDFEEDEEDAPSSHGTSVNYGKNNKVGNLKPVGGTAQHQPTDKVGNDGDHGHALHNAKQPDMGKNNKVGRLKTNQGAFQQ
jgi:hypothetical protein